MGRSVAQCALAHSVMAGEELNAIEPASMTGLRLGVAGGSPLDSLDMTVAGGLELVLTKMGKAGVRLTDKTMPLVDEMAQINARGGIIAPEALSIHDVLLDRHGRDVDPNVRVRMERARNLPAAAYISMLRDRNRLVGLMDLALQDFDALLMPTVALVAPRLDEVATPEMFAAKNAQVLRNTSIANFFDLCAISVPIPGTALPVGLMLVGRNGSDRRLLSIAGAVEHLLRG
jgi:aspartyl-tRNA(Asn)/glutamyl-tRNA(Gln) amidotransferase subunit A